jgi:hypothetical protein
MGVAVDRLLQEPSITVSARAGLLLPEESPGFPPVATAKTCEDWEGQLKVVGIKKLPLLSDCTGLLSRGCAAEPTPLIPAS